MELREIMLEKCKTAGFEPTENFDKIVKAKERMGISLKCPCCPKDKDDGRFCISELCAEEILKNGRCHCGCFKRKD